MLITLRKYFTKTKLFSCNNYASLKLQKHFFSHKLLHPKNKVRCYVELPTDDFTKDNPVALNRPTSTNPEDNLSQWVIENSADLHGVRIGKSNISGILIK